MLYFGWYANARNKSGKSNANDEMRKQLVDEVCWAGDDYGNPNLKELKTPFVISPKLYDAYVFNVELRMEARSRTCAHSADFC